MSEFHDEELRGLVVPDRVPRGAIVSHRGGNGKVDINLGAYAYYASGTEVFPMTRKQKSFYDWCIVLRDVSAAMDEVQVSGDEAQGWLSDPRATKYMLDHAREEASASRLTKTALDSILADGIFGGEKMDKNKVKLIELGLKRHGMLLEKKVLDFEDGVEIAFAVRKKDASS